MILADNITLRDEDERECLAGGFPSGRAALEHSVNNSTASYVVTHDDGEIIAYWGYKVLGFWGGGCIAWMLSAPAASTHPLFVGRQSRRMFDFLLTTYGDVYVEVHEDYVKSINWLLWLGFSPLKHTPPFIQMRAVRPELVN